MTKYYVLDIRHHADSAGAVIPFIGITKQLEVVRWFRRRTDGLSHVVATEYDVENDEEMLSIVECELGANVVDLDSFELKMIYSGDKFAPAFIDTDDLVEDYVLGNFIDETREVITKLTIFASYIRPGVSTILDKYIGIITWFNCNMHESYNKEWSSITSMLNTTAILINFIDKEGIDYYESC